MNMERIKELRRGIDSADDKLVAALDERQRIARSIVKMKREESRPLKDESREQEIVERLQQAHPELDPALIAAVYKEIFLSSTRQKE